MESSLESDGIRTPSPNSALAFDTPSPPSEAAFKTKIGESGSIVPQKRKPSIDSLEGASHHSSVYDAQRAYLARTAPHLFDGNVLQQLPHSPASPSSASSSHNDASNKSRSPSWSARLSPNPSEEEGGENSERGASIGPGSSQSDVKSRHVVPKGFRGPLPRLHDPEDIAPVPTLIPIAGSSLLNTHNHPYTRNGYIYTAAGPSTEQLPTSVYKTLLTEPRGIHWSWSDRSPFTHISSDASIVSSDRGFRSARVNVPVREGQWYVELHILPSESIADSTHHSLKDGPHVRLGWGRREAGLNAPVGINGYSYGMRDTTGEKVFLSRAYHYGKPFGPGDVVGMYISLPRARKVNAKDPMDPARIQRKRIPIRYKGRMYFETMEYSTSKEMEHLMDRSRRGEKLKESQIGEESINVASGMLVQPQIEEVAITAAKKKRKSAPGPSAAVPSQKNNLRSLPTLGPDSQIGFFINGEPQGIAFENLLDFRPLRKQAEAKGKKATVNANSSSLGLSQGGADDSSIITTSSSLASILKSRENLFDDGSLGYFPFVSLFGGAKVEIVSRGEEFRYPPPANVRQVLEEADRLRGRPRSERDDEKNDILHRCRPMEERYEEYLQELWEYDLADEEKAKAAAYLLQANAVEDEHQEEDNVVEQKPTAKSGSKKSKKKATSSSRHESPRPTSTAPIQDEQTNSHLRDDIQPVEVTEDKMKMDKEEEVEDIPVIKHEDTEEEAMDTAMQEETSQELELDQSLDQKQELMQVDDSNIM